MKTLLHALGALVSLSMLGGELRADGPNIVFILVDDQGFYDLSCYGATEFRTTAIDKLASEGVRFTDYYAAAPICSPSRAGSLTGCYPRRVGLATRVQRADSRIGIAPGEQTLVELLKSGGYATACIGKWHLGIKTPFLPRAQGFDYYFGLRHNLDPIKTVYFKDAGGVPLMRNGKVIERSPDPAKLTRLYTDEAIHFMETHLAKKTGHPATNPQSPLMLDLPGIGRDPGKIDFSKLPRVAFKHAMVSDVRDRGGKWVHQHAYLAHHDGLYWVMWSDGPGVPRKNVSPKQHRNIVPGHDQADTRVSYATSKDGLRWSKPKSLSGPPRIKGFGWIARGFWQRDGELLALASHFKAPGYPGKGLSLEAFRWDKRQNKWVAHGTVLDDALNNFPPRKLPDGRWMMSRRDHRRHVTVMIGGVKAFNKWEIRPLAKYAGSGKHRPEEPYWYVLPDGRNLVGLLRDNGGSKRLLRVFSKDNGRTWSKMVTTNFPDATSKFFVVRTSRGFYVMVSNSNPHRRDPLTIAISRDGLVFTRLLYLVGGRHVDYPHILEHAGHLLISFSGAKQTVEVLRVSLQALEGHTRKE